MTADRHAEIRKLVAAATPGEWAVVDRSDSPDEFARDPFVRMTPPGAKYGDVRDTSELSMPDAQFIAAARSAVPELLRDFDRAQVVVAAARELRACTSSTPYEEVVALEAALDAALGGNDASVE